MADLLASRSPGDAIYFRPRVEQRGSTGPAPAVSIAS
jgi:hypothetical protein